MPEYWDNIRIQNLHDTATEWEKNPSFKPEAGEIVIYDSDNTYGYPRMKVGNGTATLGALQFTSTHLHDTEENWNKVKDTFTPEAGEIVIYDPDDTHVYPRMKVGNGTATLGALQFTSPHLHGTEDEWKGNATFKPEAGEIVIYDVNTNATLPQNYPRLKIGDGKTAVDQLPFTASAASEAITVNPGTENMKEYRIVTTTDADATGTSGVITFVLY